MDMGIARAVDPLMLAILGNLKEAGKGNRDGRPRNVTGVGVKAGVNALSGVGLVSESESWLSGSGGVELGLCSMVGCVHGF